MIQVWSVTDIGMVRRENQDAFRVEERTPEGYTICVVCDGMGGPAGGRMASEIAVDTYTRVLGEKLRTLSPDAVENPSHWRMASAEAVSAANQAIRAAALEHPDYRSMGTTLVSAIARGANAVVTNVGDSRAYRISPDGIRRVTHDHSLVQNMVDRGEITPEEARYHPQRNVITRALGPDDTVVCDVFDCRMEPGTCLLLCTDGLTNTVTEQELLFEAVHGGGTEECLPRLLDISKNRGAPDNVTAVLMRWNREGGETEYGFMYREKTGQPL